MKGVGPYEPAPPGLRIMERMFQVTTIRSLPPGPDGSGPRVEVASGRPGLLARIVGAVVFVVLAAVLVVLAIVAIPLLLVALAIIAGLGLLWLGWFLIKLKLAARRTAREANADTGRENVRVRQHENAP